MSTEPLPLEWQIFRAVIAQLIRWVPTLGALVTPDKERAIFVQAAQVAWAYEKKNGKPITWEALIRANKDLKDITETAKSALFPFDFANLAEVENKVGEQLWTHMAQIDSMVTRVVLRPVSEADPTWQLLAQLGRVAGGLFLGGGNTGVLR